MGSVVAEIQSNENNLAVLHKTKRFTSLWDAQRETIYVFLEAIKRKIGYSWIKLGIHDEVYRIQRHQ